MILHAASSIYRVAATWRRHWYGADARRVRRLSRPVVSVGNLRAGGSGKTPVVAYLARLLLGLGERPAILTRGYRRRVRLPGVTVVSDTSGIRAELDTAGDEPLMLARALPGVPVLVGAHRYESGRMAEDRFAATVHLLDDGFQHLALGRDVDLLLVSEDDLIDHVLPAGRLREPLASAAAADALVVAAGRDESVERVRRALGVARAFRLCRTLGLPRAVTGGDSLGPGLPQATSNEKVFAVAGVARPEIFFKDLEAAGWNVAGAMSFADHHAFTLADLRRIDEAARGAGAASIVTTEKDAVRLESLSLPGLSVHAIPLSVTIEPSEAFAAWFLGRVRAAKR